MRTSHRDFPGNPDLRARRLARYDGKNVYRFPVARRLIDGTIYSNQTELPTLYVVAHTAPDAANYALALTLAEYREPCEVHAVGPRGGVAYRYASWFSTIGAALGRPRGTAKQERINYTTEETTT